MSADPTVRVVTAVPADWARMRALRLRALADAPDAFSMTLAEELAQPDSYWRERAQKPDVRTLRAEALGADGAWLDAGLAVVAPSSAEAGALGLYSVWVAPEARGRGAGAALVAAALGYARGLGARRVLLDVGIENPTARRVYERAGFRATGRTFALAPPREHIVEDELAADLAP